MVYILGFLYLAVVIAIHILPIIIVWLVLRHIIKSSESKSGKNDPEPISLVDELLD